MLYGKYRNIRKANWQVLIDCNVAELPVNLSKILKQYNIILIKKGENRAFSDITDAICKCIEGQWYIIYNDTKPKQRIRYTIAHELGHILLGDCEEKEADMFAIRLLAPACVLHELHAVTADDIQRLCNISRQAAENRAERMAILEKRDKFYSLPLEQELIKNFENFIKKY